ncbi:MAG: DNA-binding protein, partial [Mediterranea sp.]|nr:DNA-binding protein [Mediterranea sp.]
RVIFTPNVEIKRELAATPITITCYDRNGDIVKQVTSGDSGTVEDPDSTDPDNGGGTSGGGSDGNTDENPLG